MSRQTRYEVQGMKCAGCVANVDKALRTVPGVTHVQVDLAGRSALVDGDVDPQAIIAALGKAGYPAQRKAG
jgi:Cu+-exporting ATPase